MTIEEIQSICRRYPGVTEDVKWGAHLCFNIGGKMFLITAPDEVPCTASIKVADETFDEISAREGFMPAPYLARYKWVWMDDIRRLSAKEWAAFIDTAFWLVACRLPKREKNRLRLDPDKR